MSDRRKKLYRQKAREETNGLVLVSQSETTARAAGRVGAVAGCAALFSCVLKCRDVERSPRSVIDPNTQSWSEMLKRVMRPNSVGFLNQGPPINLTAIPQV